MNFDQDFPKLCCLSMIEKESFLSADPLTKEEKKEKKYLDSEEEPNSAADTFVSSTSSLSMKKSKSFKNVLSSAPPSFSSAAASSTKQKQKLSSSGSKSSSSSSFVSSFSIFNELEALEKQKKLQKKKEKERKLLLKEQKKLSKSSSSSSSSSSDNDGDFDTLLQKKEKKEKMDSERDDATSSSGFHSTFSSSPLLSISPSTLSIQEILNPPVDPPVYTKEIQVCSDVHLDYRDLTIFHFPMIIVPCAPILILAGDIGNPQSLLFHQFIQFCSCRFQHVLFVAGNHEYHRNGEMKGTQTHLDALQLEFRNFYFLNNSSIELSGYTFIGSTLWTNIPSTFPQEELLKIKDYRKIYKFNSSICNQLFQENVSFLKSELAKCLVQKKKAIVITHHAPLLECLEEQFVDDPLNICFVSNQMNLFRHPSLVGWIYGHTHYNYKREAGKNHISAFLYANCFRISSIPYESTGGPM